MKLKQCYMSHSLLICLSDFHIKNRDTLPSFTQIMHVFCNGIRKIYKKALVSHYAPKFATVYTSFKHPMDVKYS